MKNYSKIIILVILLCFLLFYCSSKRKIEYFEDFDVKKCGTAGFKPSKQSLDYIKATSPFGNKAPNDLTPFRLYTKSECAKLEGGKINGGPEFPYGCAGDNRPYSWGCSSLNTTIKSPAPNECKIEGAVAGKPNETFTMMKDGKEMIIEKNALQLYTKNECTILNKDAWFVTLSEILSGNSKELAAKAALANGEEYGICLHNDMSYSMLCTVDEPPSLIGDIKSSAKKSLTDWLK